VKSSTILKSELSSLENKIIESNSEEYKAAMEDIFNYEKELRTNMGKDINEMNFLKEQIN
jgi:hypothetical protein